jgi:hypothetical protein
MTILDTQIGYRPIGLAQQADEGQTRPSDDVLLAFAAPGHVATFDSFKLAVMDSDARAVPVPKMGAVAGMVQIAVSYGNDGETARPTPRRFQLFDHVGPTGVEAGVYQDIAGVGSYQAAVNAAGASQDEICRPQVDRFDVSDHGSLTI